MELPRKVTVAVAAAAAVVAADRAVFVVDDAMLQAVDTLKIYVGKHACETLFFDREVALILPHSPYQNPHQSGKQHTHTHTRARCNTYSRTRATTRESGGVNQRPLLPSIVGRKIDRHPDPRMTQSSVTTTWDSKENVVPVVRHILMYEPCPNSPHLSAGFARHWPHEWWDVGRCRTGHENHGNLRLLAQRVSSMMLVTNSEKFIKNVVNDCRKKEGIGRVQEVGVDQVKMRSGQREESSWHCAVVVAKRVCVCAHGMQLHVEIKHSVVVVTVVIVVGVFTAATVLLGGIILRQGLL
jgi:hypothetical protein